MIFTVDRDDLANLVASVVPGLPSRPNNPVYLGLLLYAGEHNGIPEVVQVTASDGDTTFNSQVEAKVHEGHESVVFPRIFADAVKSLPDGTVAVETEGGVATVRCGRSAFTFPVRPGEEYPFPSLAVPELGTVDGEQFRLALRKVLPAVSRDNPVPALTGVLLEAKLDALKLAATDKYILAASECDFEIGDCDFEGKAALLPGRQAERIARMAPGLDLASQAQNHGDRLHVGWDNGRVQVRSGTFTATCRQVDGQFPAGWEKILAAGENWVNLPEGLTDAVKRAMLTLGEKEAVTLTFGEELTVSAPGSKGGFTEALPVDYHADEVTVHAGPAMLLDALAWCGQVSVAKGKPLVFRGNDVKYMIQTRRSNAVPA